MLSLRRMRNYKHTIKYNPHNWNSNLFSIIFQTGHTALQRAAAEGHLEVVKHLIGRGAPVDHQDDVVSQDDKWV